VRPIGFPAPRGGALIRGTVMGYLSLIVLLPLAAVLWRSTNGGMSTFWTAISTPDAVSALQFTVFASLATAAINAIFGTLIAWVLVRDTLPGKSFVDSVIDLPFALPTIVAGLTLLTLYRPRSPLGVDLAYTRAGVVLALLFVTLPFVVRAVQPVMLPSSCVKWCRSSRRSEPNRNRRLRPWAPPAFRFFVALPFRPSAPVSATAWC
jgi:sulfate transport system permease protein